MDDCQPQDDTAHGQWSEQFTRTLSSQRSRVQEFVAGHRAALDQIEADLAEQLARISAELNRDRQEVEATADEIYQRAQQQSEQAEAIAQIRLALEQREAEFLTAQAEAFERHQGLAAELARRQSQLEERDRALQAVEEVAAARQRELATWRAEEELARQELASGRARVAEKETQLEIERETLAQALAETRAQRRRIAREFQDQRAAQQAFLEMQRCELDSSRNAISEREHELDERFTELEARREQLLIDSREIEAARAQLDQLAEELLAREDALLARPTDANEEDTERSGALAQALAEARDALEEIAAQLRSEREERGSVDARCAELESFAAALEEELHRTRQAHDDLVERLAHPDPGGSDELARLTSERNELERKLAQAQERQEREHEHDEEANDYRRRYELALADLKEQKARIHELEHKLAHASTPVAGNGNLDWESQKRRLMEALTREDEGAWNAGERMKVEDAIRLTEEALAAKDQQLAELRICLADGGEPSTDGTIRGASIAAAVDADEIVQQERENLRKMQDEWREKLRQAEVDLSLERARIARERATIEEKLRTLEDENSRRAADSAGGESTSAANKKPRGRWLTRLGLKDQDEP